MANNVYTDEEIMAKIRELQRERDRQYRATHKEECRARQKRYWERRAIRELEKEKTADNGGNG